LSAHILIVEDAPDLRRALGRFVERRGYRTSTAATVGEALELLETGAPDLLLSDIDLPDGSGVDLARHVRRHGLAMPVILITGLQDMAVAAEGMKAGATDFLTKPLDLDRLAEVLDRTLESARRRAESARADGAPDPEHHDDTHGPARLVGRHPTIVELFKTIGVAASGSSPVLIRGESGSGKELVAREVHRHSRPGRPFVALNCASLPDSLLESELFGHEKGAFTGADSQRKGRVELAADGTLFLDEIGDASPSFQASLLRTLQEGEIVPLGSGQPRPVRARFIAATHRPLEDLVEEGRFRADLYYRIQVLELVVPPLRERASDLPELARYLLARGASRANRNTPELSAGALRVLLDHAWPGNVRELENVLERAAMRARGDVILAEHVELAGSPAAPAGAANETTGLPSDEVALDDVVRRHVEQVLARCDGNKREAARRLDISPGRLYRILGEE
jgi:DNA-binding NtrC family response regulator